MSSDIAADQRRRRACGALLALALAALAQLLLEIARAQQEAPSLVLTVPLFLASAVLAVLVTRRRDDAFDGAWTFAIVPPRWPWWLACVPAIGCLVAPAMCIGMQPDRASFIWWLSGIGLLLAVGIAHWVVTTGLRWQPDDDLWRVLAMVAVLLLIALAMRVGGDLTRVPNFADSDEATIGLAAREMHDHPYSWLGIFWVGMSSVLLAPFTAAQLIFGDNLWGTRMGAAMIGTASVLATFGFARRIVGNLPAFIAAALLAVAHTHVHWSRTGHEFIETPAAAAIILWLFTRAWTGGTMLSWIAAGIALGLGTQTYWASYVFPVLIPITAFGWAWTTEVSWKRALALTAAVELIGLLILAPVARMMVVRIDPNANRPQYLYLFNSANLEKLGSDKTTYLVHHVTDALLMFNTGVDSYPNYHAMRSLVDPVTAALVPIAVFMLLVRLRSPVGWLCLAWWGAYLSIGEILVADSISYHRVPTALLFACIGVGWAFTTLLRVIREGFGLPQTSVVAAGLLLAAGAAGANAYFYFYEYPRSQGLAHSTGYTEIVCSYEHRMPVVDAAIVDTDQYVPQGAVPFIKLECPNLKWITVQTVKNLWKVDQLTDAPEVALIIPKQLEDLVPGTPEGYRIKRHYIDERITYPYLLPVSVYELERDHQ